MTSLCGETAGFSSSDVAVRILKRLLLPGEHGDFPAPSSMGNTTYPESSRRLLQHCNHNSGRSVDSEKSRAKTSGRHADSVHFLRAAAAAPQQEDNLFQNSTHCDVVDNQQHKLMTDVRSSRPARSFQTPPGLNTPSRQLPLREQLSGLQGLSPEWTWSE